ncbi:unnamed protein product [Ambrosiozyma monospora]|uniref:Unnamed protein product n=1 Tax=Ambrosiozyma monospora TaxID=43982 RepID=A0ACB5T7Z7_AMBMO|nr:unnamed protein product [Ambrosiozyma monospora]
MYTQLGMEPPSNMKLCHLSKTEKTSVDCLKYKLNNFACSELESLRNHIVLRNLDVTIILSAVRDCDKTHSLLPKFLQIVATYPSVNLVFRVIQNAREFNFWPEEFPSIASSVKEADIHLLPGLLDSIEFLDLENATSLKKLKVSFNKRCEQKFFRPLCKPLHELVINVKIITVHFNLSGCPNMKKLRVLNANYACFPFGIGHSVEDLVLKDFLFSSSETFNLPPSLKSLDVSGINLHAMSLSETLTNISIMRAGLTYLYTLDSVINILPPRISTMFIEFHFQDLTIDLALFPPSIQLLYFIDPRGITILVSFRLRDPIRTETSRITLSRLPSDHKIEVDLSAVKFDLSTYISIEQTQPDCLFTVTLPEADIDPDRLQIWKYSDISSSIRTVRNETKVQENSQIK